jgi:NodT family efflux transporter outer membrane factor (OMF) lipoprotein
MSPWNRTGALAAAAALGACTTVGPNFKTPAAPTAPGYAMAGDARDGAVVLTAEARSMGPWWRALGSARLDAVMDEALADNQTVAKALATLDKARAEADSARGNAGPKVDATASAQRERINIAAFGISGFPNPTINLISVGAQVSYDLDIFGGNRRRIETAAAAQQAEGRRADAAYLALTGNVAMQAVRIAQIRDQIAAVNAIIADDRRNLDIIHAAQAAGGEAPAASTGGEAQLAADQALLPPLAQSLSQARHALAELVGKSPAEWTAPDFAVGEFTAPAQIPVALPSALVRHRPDILAAEADLHADTARIGVATANLYPDIKLAASWAQSALTPGGLFGYGATGWSLGPSLTAPIFHSGALKADKRAAEAQARASLAQYRQTVLTAFVQVSDVMSALAHDDEAIGALSTAQAVAEAALRDARAAYSLGGGPLSAIDNAQVQVDRARLQLVEARGRRLLDVIQLFAATASDWRESPHTVG